MLLFAQGCYRGEPVIELYVVPLSRRVIVLSYLNNGDRLVLLVVFGIGHTIGCLVNCQSRFVNLLVKRCRYPSTDITRTL